MHWIKFAFAVALVAAAWDQQLGINLQPEYRILMSVTFLAYGIWALAPFAWSQRAQESEQQLGLETKKVTLAFQVGILLAFRLAYLITALAYFNQSLAYYVLNPQQLGSFYAHLLAVLDETLRPVKRALQAVAPGEPAVWDNGISGWGAAITVWRGEIRRYREE